MPMPMDKGFARARVCIELSRSNPPSSASGKELGVDCGKFESSSSMFESGPGAIMTSLGGGGGSGSGTAFSEEGKPFLMSFFCSGSWTEDIKSACNRPRRGLLILQGDC